VITIRLSRLLSLGRGLVALLYFGGLALSPLGDALLQASTLDQEQHVETESDAQCVTGHDKLFCQLCRLVEFSKTAPTRSAVAFVEPEHHRQNVDRTRSPATSAIIASRAARAPPIL
jgi:hypothetical protein